jgi:hypothetical protein
LIFVGTKLFLKVESDFWLNLFRPVQIRNNSILETLHIYFRKNATALTTDKVSLLLSSYICILVILSLHDIKLEMQFALPCSN